MAFHEIQFPTGVTLGTRGGPGFSTSIVEGDAGGSERVSRWPNARRRFNAKYGIKTQDQLSQVMDFYVARQGPAIGFRYKDWNDFTTAANHRDPPAPTDVLLGTATGASGQFQLRTKYVSGPSTIYRSITKPVAGTTRIARTPSGGGAAVELFNFSVNTTTGLISVNTGMTAGDSITYGGEFDVPAQFGAELDEVLAIAITDWNNGEVPDIPIVEMIGEVASPERFYYGGGGIVPSGISQSLDLSKRAWIFQGSTPAVGFLADPADLETGGPYQHFVNAGTANWTLKTFDNSATILTLAAGKSAFSVLYQDGSGINRWGLLSN